MKVRLQLNEAEIKQLGFSFEFMEDDVFENQHGEPWVVVRLRLNKRTSVDWDQLTGFLKLVVISSPKNGNLVCELPIHNRVDLKEAIKRKI